MGQGAETLGDMYDFYDFDDEEYIRQREEVKKKPIKPVVTSTPRGVKIIKKCSYCGEDHVVREADLKRGWGKFCSKSCKAKEQERRTHQNHNYLMNNS